MRVTIITAQENIWTSTIKCIDDAHVKFLINFTRAYTVGFKKKSPCNFCLVTNGGVEWNLRWFCSSVVNRTTIWVLPCVSYKGPGNAECYMIGCLEDEDKVQTCFLKVSFCSGLHTVAKVIRVRCLDVEKPNNVRTVTFPWKAFNV